MRCLRNRIGIQLGRNLYKLSQLPKFLSPAKTVPQTSWTAATLWSVTPKRAVILTAGLFLMGMGGAITVQSELGNPPWTVLAQGLGKQLNIPLGWAFFLVSCVVLLTWIPLRVLPGFGTLANAVIFAAALQFGVSVIPQQDNFLISLLMVLIGVVFVGFGTAVYITCGLGSGPRDGWMIGVVKRTGVRIWKIRFGMEFFALSLGFFLGGTVGIGTVLVMLLIGQTIAISFTILSQIPGAELTTLVSEV